LHLWGHIDEHAAAGTTLQLQFQAFELRGDACYDLLTESFEVQRSQTNPANESKTTPALKDTSKLPVLIGEGEDGQVQVKSASQFVSSKPHLLQLLEQASWARRTTTTRSNEASSRSHAFYRFSLVPQPSHGGRGDTAPAHSISMLQVIDLAGNERWEDASSHDMECIQEMKAINYSLGCLKECTRLLLKGDGTGYVPFRRSKLTLLLRDQLQLAASSSTTAESEALEDAIAAAVPAAAGPTFLRRVLCVAHLAPLRSGLKHTLNTLTFVHSICTKDSRAEIEAKNFKGPLL